MAAAALSGCRGAAGGRSTKGLFFIFSLLCVLCLASSLMLEEAKESRQRTQQELDRVKAQKAYLLWFIATSTMKADTYMEFVKEASEELSDYPQFNGYLQIMKDNLKEIKTIIDDRKGMFDVEIEKLEQELEKQSKEVKALEDRVEL